MNLNLEWSVGHMKNHSDRPERFVPAQVPGNANLDWAAATGIPDWRQGTNYQLFKWMEDRFWVYKTNIPNIKLKQGQSLYFVSKGIDYQYEVYLNEKLVFEHEGMFTSFELELGREQFAGAELKILIFPVPKDKLGLADTRQEAAQSCNPAVGYGWDWHPRLIPFGMWEDAFLEIREEEHIVSAKVEYCLNDSFDCAEIDFFVQALGEELRYYMFAPDGTQINPDIHNPSFLLEQPELWWCNGYGEPNLYSWKVVLRRNGQDIDVRSGKIGIRHIELVMNEGGWNEPSEFPKGRSVAPVTICLNGISVFAKGSNWVNPEIFTGTIDRETYRPLVESARLANFNIFRCWGGAIINKDSFYDLCDENGIMVWQEFMLACNNYRGTAHYLKILEQEATAVVNRLKSHPSIVIWCGGNELFNNWSGMTDQSLALRLLNKICYEYDPERPYMMTSPLYGMGHGCYRFNYPDGREVYEVMPHSCFTAYSEFGVPSLSNLDCCRIVAPEESLFPLQENEVTVAHHAFRSWDIATDTWCDITTLRRYFGEPTSLPQMIEWSQWMQGEGYRCVFEEARRQKPYCSMAINWCYNEPWPTLANNSIINYPASPKQSYTTVAAACRSTLVSARIPHFAWNAGSEFEVELWLLNDSKEIQPSGEVEVYLELLGKKYYLIKWEYGGISPNKNVRGPTVRFNLPGTSQLSNERIQLNGDNQCFVRGNTHPMKLILSAGKLSSEYMLIYYDGIMSLMEKERDNM